MAALGTIEVGVELNVDEATLRRWAVEQAGGEVDRAAEILEFVRQGAPDPLAPYVRRWATFDDENRSASLTYLVDRDGEVRIDEQTVRRLLSVAGFIVAGFEDDPRPSADVLVDVAARDELVAELDDRHNRDEAEPVDGPLILGGDPEPADVYPGGSTVCPVCGSRSKWSTRPSETTREFQQGDTVSVECSSSWHGSDGE